jgi:hypothetical protein
VTFERDGQRYQRTLGDCDQEHTGALHDAMRWYATALLENGKADLSVMMRSFFVRALNGPASIPWLRRDDR